MPVSIYLLNAFDSSDVAGAKELKKHLTPLSRTERISFRFRDPLDTDANDRELIAAADMILLLVSPDLYDQCFDLTKHAMEQLTTRKARVIPVLFRSLQADDIMFKELRPLPDSPIALRRDKDDAWVQVVTGIRRVVEALEKEKEKATPPLQQPATVRQAALAAASPQVAAPVGQLSRGQVKLLFLGANPTNTTRMSLGTEVSSIERRLQMGALRDRFDMQSDWAVTAGDLTQILLRRQPTIVHFSGHGTATGQLILEDDQHKAAPVPAAALTSLFRIFAAKGVLVVVLNACHSADQAKAIHQYVPCVVGISDTIPDHSAQAFSAGFYTGLVHGENIQTAFELGCVQIDLLGASGSERPVLYCRDPQAMRLV